MDDKNLNAKPPSRQTGAASSTDNNGGAVQPPESLKSEAATTPLPFVETPHKEDDSHGSAYYTACTGSDGDNNSGAVNWRAPNEG